MNKKEYLAKRKQLLEEAENLLNEGKLEEYKQKEKEIQDLDEKFEAYAKAQANMSALKEKKVDDVAASMIDQGNGTVATAKPVEVKDEKTAYLYAWAKEMMGQPLSEQEKTVFDKFNADIQNSVQTTTQHAVVIPETVRDEIWKEAGELYPILGDVRMTFVPGDLTIIKETDSGEDAAWYEETDTVEDGDFQLGTLNLTGCELAKSIPISWKLRKMSIDAFITYVTNLLAEKMGAALAKAIVTGLGKPGGGDTFKPQPRGIVTVLGAESGTPQIITYDDANDKLSYDKLAQAMGLIKSQYKSGAAIYAKNSVIWGQLALLKDDNGRPLFIPDVTSGGVGRIFGVVVKEEDSVPEGGILVGNVARGYVMNVNENMTIYTQDHVKQRYTDYMGYAIVDGDVLTSKAFAYIEKVEQA